MKIDADIMAVLESAKIDGNQLVLTGQLDRKTYESTNKVLVAIGGKWNKSAKAHCFEEDPFILVDQILLTGEYNRTKQDFGQFDTPSVLAEQIVVLADVRPNMSVLEPSAGIGNIASAIKQMGANATCWEIDPKRAEKLKSIAHLLNVGDFLAVAPEQIFDRVVMNPPFAQQADIDHVRHAAKFLKPGGRLVSIMSASILFRTNAKTVQFRDFVHDKGGLLQFLPDESFRQSGTSVKTALVSFNM